jgi:hypothetical protein
MTPNEAYIIPMTLYGVASSFPTHKPTILKWETLPHIVLSSEDPSYDPHDTFYAKRENALAKHVLETGDRVGAPPLTCLLFPKPSARTDYDAMTLLLKQISTVYDNAAFGKAMHTNIASIHAASVGPNLKPQVWLKNWGIDIKTATRTINTTTQCGIHTVLHSTLSQQFRTNNQQLQYRQLPIDCITDTMFTNTTSIPK